MNEKLKKVKEIICSKYRFLVDFTGIEISEKWEHDYAISIATKKLSLNDSILEEMYEKIEKGIDLDYILYGHKLSFI